MRERCPRCKSETFELGAPIIKVGKTREMRLLFENAPQCMLVFYERIRESPSYAKDT